MARHICKPDVLLPDPVVARGTAQESTIIVRPMLTTAQKNFRDVQHPPSILSQTVPPKTTREELDVPGARCFLLRSLLTPEECRYYVKETERIGYSDLSALFPREYRSNERVLAICQPLVECLWTRLQPHLSRREVVRVRPIGFGNEGTWKPFRLNECCKFGKYKAGGHFSPHMDGPWVPHEDESSVFTVVIYLNSDFRGGGTRFLNEHNRKKTCSVSPRAGTALIFNHDTLHEGLPVTRGVKYIVRTEIMYRRVDRDMIPDPLSYKQDGDYLTTLALYQKSWRLEQEGDSQAFTDTYLQAIQMQCRAQRSVGTGVEDVFSQALPFELYLIIFSFLSAPELCRAMRVCKAWYDMAMDGQLWYDLYRHRWPLGIGLEAKLDHTNTTLAEPPPPFIKDWYGLFKQRIVTESPGKIMIIDLGTFSCKCAVVKRAKSSIKTHSIESVVAMAPGIFDLHMRLGEWERYFCGRDAKERYPNHIVQLIERGIPVRPNLLPEILTGFYYNCHVRPKHTPVVILEPPGLWSSEIRDKVALSFVKMYEQPSVSFLSSAVATLCGVEQTSGVVADVGHGVATCCAVWQGCECPTPLSCDPTECHAHKVAEMVHSTVASCSEDAQPTLRHTVVLTGGKAPSASAVEQELKKLDSGYTLIQPSTTPCEGAVSFITLTGYPRLSHLLTPLTKLGASAGSVEVFYKYIWNRNIRAWAWPLETREECPFGTFQESSDEEGEEEWGKWGKWGRKGTNTGKDTKCSVM